PNPTTEGTLTFNNDGSYTFVATPGFSGTVTFDYQVCDDGTPSECSTATVTIEVTTNQPPVADNETETTNEDQSITFSIVDGDTDVDGTIVASTIVLIDPSNAANTGNSSTPLFIAGEGKYEVTASGILKFTPALNFNGTSTINYTIRDNNNALSNVAVVTVNVTPVNDPPVADNETVTTNEDTPITVDVLVGDTDVDGTIDPATVVLIDPSNAANTGNSSTPLVIVGEGTYTVDNTGKVTFTPELNYNGSAKVFYTVNDNDGATSNVARLDITVTPVNDGPLAVDDVESTGPGVTLNATVVTNDGPDPEGNSVTHSIVGASPNTTTEGTLTFRADGTYTFVPVASFSGAVSFDYRVCDSGSPQVCSEATVTINVGANTPPVANDDLNNTTAEGQAITNINLPGNDTDADGTVVASSIQLIDPSNAANKGGVGVPLVISEKGTYTITAAGLLTFTPVAGFNGDASINYTIKDNLGATSNVAQVQITVTPVNDGPTAIDDYEVVTAGGTLNATVVTNDIADPENDALTYSLTTAIPNPTTEGTLTFNNDGSYTFVAAAGFTTVFTFDYEVCDDGVPSKCSTATVTIDGTNNPPVADDDDAIIPEDNPVTIFILNGDSDSDGTLNPFSIVLIDPSNSSNRGNSTTPLVIAGEGTYSVDALGNLTFTPLANYNGTSTINYTVNDNLGAKSNVAKVTIVVTPVNDPPVAVDDSGTVLAGGTLNSSVSGNDTDVDNTLAQLTFTLVSGGTAAMNGTLTFNANGTYSFVPNTNFSGTVTFTYKVCDPGSLCDEATVTITVNPISAPNEPPVAVSDTETMDEDTVLNKTVASNDSDPDNSAAELSYKLTNGGGTAATNGTLTLQPNGSYTYTPNENFNGIVSFTYEVCDPSGACSSATVTITVTPVNDKPIAEDDTFIIAEDNTLSGTVITNDKDPEDQPLTITLVDGGTAITNGTLTLNPDGTFTFVPKENYNGVVEFTYSACDNGTPVQCDEAKVTITVNPVRDLIIANDDDFTNNVINGISGGITVNILTNDRLSDKPVAIALVNVALVNAGGVTGLSINSTGNVVVPANTPAGDYTITYRICEKADPTNCDDATVKIKVGAPTIVATNDDYSTNIIAGTIGGVAGNVLSNDSLNSILVAANKVKISIVDAGGLTGITISTSGVVSVPAGTKAGDYVVTYNICELLNPNNCDDATILIKVSALRIVAENDDFSGKPIEPKDGGTAGNVLANDSLGGNRPNPVDVVISITNGGGITGLTVTPNGDIIVPPNTPEGTYTITYSICEKLNPTNCDTATIIIHVKSSEVVSTITISANSICVDNSPRLEYNVVAIGFNPNGRVTLRWERLDGTVVLELTNQPLTGTILWPGSELDANGNMVKWPGWTLENGIWIKISDGLRPQLRLRVISTVQNVVTVNYPISTTTCAVDPNNPPVTEDIEITQTGDQPINGDISDTTSDPDGDNLVYTLIEGPLSGTVVVNPDGSFTYTPELGFVGTVVFTYQVCDDGNPVLCTTGKVTITIEPPAGITVGKLVTPNGDGVNDFLEIKGIDQYPDNKVLIFNRWGNVVWETRAYINKDNSFSGFANRAVVGGNSSDLPDATYFYLIDLGDGKTFIKGFFELKR
uniref:Ig-like domain-containing protein n=1 Tax=Fulvivirga sp. TaxID=1931237 RepID=UPI00404AAE43